MDDLSRTSPKRLGEYLRDAGILSPSQIVVALYDQRRTGMKLGEILVLRGWVESATINQFLHKQVRSRLYSCLESHPREPSEPRLENIDTSTFVVQDFN